MAGDWLKVEHTTPDKPEIVSIAAILKVPDHDLVFAKCFRLWVWGNQHSESGDDLTVTDGFIDRLTSLHGFADALRKVGWLSGRDGRLSIPNFARHNGQSAKTRAVEALRKRRQREQGGQMSRNERDKCPDNVPVASGQKAGPEKRREEYKKERENAGAQEPHFPEAEIPTIEEVCAYGELIGVTREVCQAMFEHYDGNNLWLNRHGVAIKWKSKLKSWEVREKKIKNNGNSNNRQGHAPVDRNAGTANAGHVSDYAGL